MVLKTIKKILSKERTKGLNWVIECAIQEACGEENQLVVKPKVEEQVQSIDQSAETEER